MSSYIKALIFLVILGLFSSAVDAQSVHHVKKDLSNHVSEEEEEERLMQLVDQYVSKMSSNLTDLDLPALTGEQEPKIRELYKNYKQAIDRIDATEGMRGKERTASKARLTKSLNNDVMETLSSEQAQYFDRDFREEFAAKKRAEAAPKPAAPKPPTSGELADSELLTIEAAVDGAGLAPMEKGQKNQLRNSLLQRQMEMGKQESSQLTESVLYTINAKLRDSLKAFLPAEYITVVEQALEL